MKESEILSNVAAKLGITSLKPMQIELAAASAPRITLAAPTGSGKTVAFTIQLLKRMPQPGRGVAAVVMAPSRELVLQIASVVKAAAAGYKITAIYGGHKMDDEKKSLTPVPDIIVATPGRLLDHLNRRTLDLSETEILVLDEYDKCVELGFDADMRRIVKKMPALKSVILTSATVAQAIPDYLPDGQWQSYDYSADSRSSALQKVHVDSPTVDKAQTLVALLCSMPERKTIVFVNHRESAERLHAYLKKARISAALYHGGLDQHTRQMAVELLHNGTVDVLVATDLAARGLDIDAVDAVIHYHLPPTAENWIHRNGRTARNGAPGTAYIITSEADSIPDYVDWSRDYVPKDECDASAIASAVATIHLNAGRKEKISRGDILGFIMAHTDISSQSIGRITVFDHEALAAVPASGVPAILAAASAAKIKNKKVRVTRVVT